MSRSPLLVLADDLTGAAELAALAHQAGLHALVLTTPPKEELDADVLVFDTGTRLDPAPAAARKVRQLVNRLKTLPHAGLFKKVDSVLRGNVTAETEAIRESLDLARTLLLPCNPSLGRTIYNQLYYVAGKPLHRTAFAQDPHHPRRSSNVLRLLEVESGPAIACCHPADRLPRHGIIVGEARSPADVALWAAQLDEKTLPAGGADFFRAWLVQQGTGRRPAAADTSIVGPALLLSGTATPPDPATPLPGSVVSLFARDLPTAPVLAADTRALLAADGFASLIMSGPLSPRRDAPEAINTMFARAARRLHTAAAFRHLLIAGGTTAASVLDELGWTRLTVVHVWGPGVVTVRPADAANIFITLKPGSYAWPVALRRHFEPTIAASA